MYNMYRRKLFEIAVVMFTITIYNPSFIWCNHDTIAWDKCTDLLVKLDNCSLKIHLPTSCEHDQKSESLQCAEDVLKNIKLCNNLTGIQMIRHYVETYQYSDRILCQKHLYTEFVENKRCTTVASLIVELMASLPSRSLSTKGCEVTKSIMYLHAVGPEQIGCYDLITEYIDRLYEKSSCSHVHVKAPTNEYAKHISTLLNHLATCWIAHLELPLCKNSFVAWSKQRDCVNGINTTGVNDAFNIIINNVLEVSMETDEVLCIDKQLRNDFKNHKNCLKFVSHIGILIVKQANGLLTKLGCKAMKYKENIKMASFDPRCEKMLLQYKRSMDKVLPCHEEPPAPTLSISFAQSIHTNQLRFVYVILVIMSVLILNTLNSVLY